MPSHVGTNDVLSLDTTALSWYRVNSISSLLLCSLLSIQVLTPVIFTLPDNLLVIFLLFIVVWYVSPSAKVSNKISLIVSVTV